MLNTRFSGKMPSMISGLGCVSGAGFGVNKLWEDLSGNIVRCDSVPEWLFETILPFPVFSAPRNALSPAAQQLLTQAGFTSSDSLNRTIQLALSALAEAMDMASLTLEELRKLKVGFALGTTVGCGFHDLDYYSSWLLGNSPEPSPVHNFLDGNLAMAMHRILGTSGPAIVVTNACASGTDAIGLANYWLENEKCDLCIAGGSDHLSIIAYNGFSSLMLTSKTKCAPFDQNRQGLNLGEGAGVLILESQSSVLERKSNPLAKINGYGTAADAYHPTAPHPEGRGLQSAFRQAVSSYDGDINEIKFINGHGTGTKANDQAETNAVNSLFPDNQVTLVSSKGVTGHTLGAAGGIEAILTIKALTAGESPGTVGCSKPDPEFKFSPASAGKKICLSSKIGASQSLAFGGGNSVLIMEAV
jgi:3-oxoacyl-(acyl-carrier-protein) synthase